MNWDDLIAWGQQRGYLTYDELNGVLPDNLTAEQLDHHLRQLEDLGIQLVDANEPVGSDTMTITDSGNVLSESEGSCPLEERNPAWQEAIRALGVPVTDLVCWRDGEGRVYQARLIVPGEQAVANWWILRERAAEFGWPVLHGPHAGGEVTQLRLLSAAPEQLRERARHLLAEADRITPDPRTFHRWHEGGLENLSQEEWQALCEQPDLFVPPADKEAADQVAFDELVQGRLDIRTLEVAPFVEIALAPTAVPWEVFAYWPTGGFNGAPWPAEQLAMHRSWHQRYGAELLGYAHDWHELYVPRPPRSRADALLLTREMCGFGEETILGYQTLSTDEVVRRVRASRYWYFWWD
jgi:hypothetical protein